MACINDSTQTVSQCNYNISFLKRIFLRKNWKCVFTKHSKLTYYKAFSGNFHDNILIMGYEWKNDNDVLLARKISITANKDTIYAHLTESKEVVETFEWLYQDF